MHTQIQREPDLNVGKSTYCISVPVASGALTSNTWIAAFVGTFYNKHDDVHSHHISFTTWDFTVKYTAKCMVWESFKGLVWKIKVGGIRKCEIVESLVFWKIFGLKACDNCAFWISTVLVMPWSRAVNGDRRLTDFKREPYHSLRDMGVCLHMNEYQNLEL